MTSPLFKMMFWESFRPLLDIAVAKVDDFLPVASAPEDLDVVGIGVGCSAAGQREGLHDVHPGIHYEGSRSLDLAEHVDLVSPNFLE